MRFAPGLCAVALALVFVLHGCVYPRRTPSLVPVQRPTGLGAPADLYRLTIVRADIAQERPGALPWDDDGGPDVFVRVFRDEERLFETETIDDSFTPEWNATLPRNVHIQSSSALRFEVWDRDTIGADPIGHHRSRGLPETARSGGESRVLLSGGRSHLTIRVEPPIAHRGSGISEVEVRPDALVVLGVHTRSPAGRAGLEVGDEIVEIAGERVSELGEARALSALSMASRGEARVTYRRGGREETVRLDREYVWLSM